MRRRFRRSIGGVRFLRGRRGACRGGFHCSWTRLPNLGTGIATNTTHGGTWDVAADWNADLGNIRVEILAKDERGLHPIRWKTIPGEGGDPEVTISAEPFNT